MVSTLTQIMTFVIILGAFLSVYGISSGLPNINNTLNQITGPWPTISTSSCSFSVNGPTAGCNLLDTLFLGGTWFLASIGSILFRIGALFFLLFQLVGLFGPLTGIPVLGPAFVTLFIFIITLYAGAYVRGKHSET